ncbi:phage tail length tape measure family protein [Nocardioides marmorisolisilvae]|uniref:phage tail length tape measure family protein n=1 Tax=Nocardioides marmorisolisilvae TaxID=1542737 RepID=UPI0011CDD25E|nr:phage tail length tape measure family protein [Nocardioides marmorisolisilvae]
MADDLVAELDVEPVLRNVRASIVRQAGGDFERAGADIGRRAGDSAAKTMSTRLGHGLKEGLSGIGLGIVAGLGVERLFDSIIEESEQAIRVTKITAQEIATTGGAAHVTAGQVNELANQMSEYAAIDDEVIQSGENVLLTFRKVRNEVGAGNDIFDRATKASLDLSTVLGTDLNSTVKQLGKALNDPVKGITALGRAGVQFTAGQKAQIKALVDSNRLLDAQKIILTQVEHNVGGAAGANATAFDRLGVSVKNLEESLGTVLLPVLDKAAEATSDEVIPTLRTGGGIVEDFAHAWDGLPGPIKEAAGAVAAFKAAQALGLTTSLASGAAAAGSAVSSLALRTSFMVGVYRQEIGAATGATAANGRLAASYTAVKAAAAGSGAVVGTFAKTAGSVALLAGSFKLLDSLAPDDKAVARYVDRLEALAGPKIPDQIDRLNEELKKQQQIVDDAFGPTFHVFGSTVTPFDFGSDWKTADEKVRQIKDQISELKHQEDLNTIATKQAASATGTYVSEVDKANTSIQKLIASENKRHNALLGQFNDATALAQQLRDARKEAADGARTLDINTEAGLKNRDALGQLAGQWNSSANAVKNAKGAYTGFRDDFIKIAESMGATKGEAKKLADQLIQIPTNKAINVDTPGMREAREQARLLKLDLLAAQVAGRNIVIAQGARNRSELQDRINKAGGGSIFGPGTATSDSIPAWLSNGEFVQRAAAVDYYGLPFMKAINEMRLPRFAGGGQVGSSSSNAPVSLAGTRLALLIGGQVVEGVIAEIADTRIGAQRQIDAMQGRAYGG